LYQTLQGNPFINLKEMTRVLLDSYKEFDTSKLLMTQPGEAPSMADYRPGKAKMQDEGGSEAGGPQAGMQPEGAASVPMGGMPGPGGQGPK
jgi:hypothetical protein